MVKHSLDGYGDWGDYPNCLPNGSSHTIMFNPSMIRDPDHEVILERNGHLVEHPGDGASHVFRLFGRTIFNLHLTQVWYIGSIILYSILLHGRKAR